MIDSGMKCRNNLVNIVKNDYMFTLTLLSYVMFFIKQE